LEKQVQEAKNSIVATNYTNVTTKKPYLATAVATEKQPVTTEKLQEKPIVTVLTRTNLDQTLPSSLIPTFNELLNAESFLTYAQLASRIGKKEATARAYVNDMKNRGVSFEEQALANGKKQIRLAKKVRQEFVIPD